MTSPSTGKKMQNKTVSKEDLSKLSKEELVAKLSALQIYVEELENKFSSTNSNSTPGSKKFQQNADSLNLIDGIGQEERFRQQQLEASRRENVLVMRLTTKEQEVQDYLAQLEELRSSVGSGVRNLLLDPAVNAVFQRMKQELQQTKEKLDQSLEELDAWKFTPDSNMGKRLMSRCRTLIQENQELGTMTSVGRIAKLEGDLSVVKKVCEDLKTSQTDMDGFLLELDEDMEGMQTTVMSLQRQVNELRDENRLLKQQLVGVVDDTNAKNVKKEHMSAISIKEEQRTTSCGGVSPSSSTKHLNVERHLRHPTNDVDAALDNETASSLNSRTSSPFSDERNGSMAMNNVVEEGDAPLMVTGAENDNVPVVDVDDDDVGAQPTSKKIKLDVYNNDHDMNDVHEAVEDQHSHPVDTGGSILQPEIKNFSKHFTSSSSSSLTF